MRKSVIRSVLISIPLFVCGCSCNNHSGKGSSASVLSATQKYVFTQPEIPGMITDEEQRVRWLAEHYWDNADFSQKCFSDTLSRLSYKSFGNYLIIVQNAFLNPVLDMEWDKVRGIVGATIGKMAVNPAAVEMASVAASDLLDDPNSMFRNEELYLCVMDSVRSHCQLSARVEDLFVMRYDAVSKNRIGQVATDFSFVTDIPYNGRKFHNMSSVESPLLMILFNNPGCKDCRRVKDYIENSAAFSRSLSSGILKILAIYPDAQLDEWKKEVYPKDWINGYDHTQSINNDGLYDLRAIPMIYLLDSQKRVIFKDAPVELVETYLIAY